MTKPLRAVIEIILKNLVTPRRVLEIGSRQAKNQEDLANLRVLLPGSKYLGLDMLPGSGVDVVADANSLPFDDNSFDLILCLETIEHADKPWLVSAEIERVLKRSGVAIVSSQQNFPLHKHPSDFFRYTPFGLKALLPGLKYNLVIAVSPPFGQEVKLNPQHVIFVGAKKNISSDLGRIKRAVKKNIEHISGHKPYRHRLIDGLRLMKRALQEAVFRHEVEFF